MKYDYLQPPYVLEEGYMHEEREVNVSQRKTDKLIEINTLKGVGKIPALAETVHANGGKVIATCVVCNPWILTNLEPYCDEDGNYYRSGFGLRY